MIGGFFDRLFAQTREAPHDDDARLAIAALMVRVARADFEYDDVEKERIDALLARRFALSLPDAQALRAQGETLEADAPDTVRFTRAIKDAIPLEERIAVIEALWAVVLADETRDEHEDALLRVVSNLLGISDADSNMARQRAARS